MDGKNRLRGDRRRMRRVRERGIQHDIERRVSGDDARACPFSKMAAVAAPLTQILSEFHFSI